MIHYVPLERVPDDLIFPDNLKARFWYDDTRKALVFDGFMSKAAFDRLWQLSNDSEYRRALEHLFQISIPEDSPAAKHPHPVVVAIGLAVLVVLVFVGVIVIVW